MTQRKMTKSTFNGITKSQLVNISYAPIKRNSTYTINSTILKQKALNNTQNAHYTKYESYEIMI